VAKTVNIMFFQAMLVWDFFSLSLYDVSLGKKNILSVFFSGVRGISLPK